MQPDQSAVRTKSGREAHTSFPSPLWEGISLSVQALSWVFDNSESELGARHVLLSIANHAKANGTGAWPSVRLISKESRLSETTVHRAMKELVALGELHVQKNKGPHGTNLYSLPKMLGCQNATPSQIGGEGVPNCLLPPSKMAPEPSLTSTVRDKEASQNSRRVYPRSIRESKAKAEALTGQGPQLTGRVKASVLAKFQRGA
jgi:hypothetical protein